MSSLSDIALISLNKLSEYFPLIFIWLAERLEWYSEGSLSVASRQEDSMTGVQTREPSADVESSRLDDSLQTEDTVGSSNQWTFAENTNAVKVGFNIETNQDVFACGSTAVFISFMWDTKDRDPGGQGAIRTLMIELQKVLGEIKDGKTGKLSKNILLLLQKTLFQSYPPGSLAFEVECKASNGKVPLVEGKYKRVTARNISAVNLERVNIEVLSDIIERIRKWHKKRKTIEQETSVTSRREKWAHRERFRCKRANVNWAGSSLPSMKTGHSETESLIP